MTKSLVMPSTFVEVKDEEVEYLEGKGSIVLCISAETIGSAIGGFVFGAAATIGCYFAGKIAKLAWMAGIWGAVLILAAAAIGAIVGALVANCIAKSCTSGSQSFKVASGWFTPNITITL